MATPQTEAPGALAAAKEALDLAHEISKLLDTGLDKETLSILIALIETGVNPEALANVVKELRRESAELKAALAAVAAQPPLLVAQASEGEPSEAQLS